MAKKDEAKRTRRIKDINNSLDIIDSKMDDIFKTTYNSRQDNKKVLDKVSDDIYSIVNDIMSGSEDIQNIPNITRLYSRIDNKNNAGGGNGYYDAISDLLSNKALLSTIATTPETNKYLKMLDAQYDMICKYMPKLQEALDIKKDNVLSADNFNKDFINFVSDKLSTEDKKVFDQRNIEASGKYKFAELCDKMYDDAAKYGEYFLYCVPYKKAFEKLMNGKNATNIDGVRTESTISIIENGNIVERTDKLLGNALASLDLKDKPSNISVTFDKSYMMSSVIKEYAKYKKIKKKVNEQGSLYEAFTEASLSKEVFGKELDIGKEYDKIAMDGLTDMSIASKKEVKIDDIPGCITKKLIHENVYPIYIEDMCIGYYYFEFSYQDEYNPARNNIINGSTFPSHDPEAVDGVYQENPLLRELSKKISDVVDSQFINANQDLKDEIYIMLKYNEKFNTSYDTNNIRVTFLPAEDVYHFYFELDEKTHHGISDLSKSLTPAMFWCLLDLSTTMGLVTRSQDKRIYYVKQNVDTNVAKTLMNVVNQVKKGNFGVRQMESMNNILNIVGRYNDHVIPLGPSGDPPIQFEIMQGQNIETPEALMNKWEESAINATDVPLEIVNSSMQADFAIKYTMSNSKFLRKVFKRQFVCEKRFTEIYTRIYNYEYNENEVSIKVCLPAPAFLSMTNSTQLIQNTIDFIGQIAQVEYPNGPEEEKNVFVKMMLRHYLPTHINVPLIDRIKDMATIEVAADPNRTEEEQ